MKKKIIVVCSCCLIVFGVLYSIRLVKEKNQAYVGVMGDTVYADTLDDRFLDEDEEGRPEAGTDDVTDPEPLQAEELIPVQTEVFVYVCGEVAKPGVYAVSPEARIIDAVTAAGGLTEDALEGAVNLAANVTDGMEVYIPGEDDDTGGFQVYTGFAGNTVTASVFGPAEPSDGKININTAGSDELTKLSGIGESRAADIIAYRESAGGFSKIEDIMKVPGIKDGIFNRIKDKIKCE